MTQQRTFPENVSQPTALSEIRARLEAATPGPWESDGADITQAGPEWGGVVENTVSCGSYCYGGSIRQDAKPADIRFITHSRTDVARLLNALQAIQEFAVIAEELCDLNRSPRKLASVPVVQIRNAIAAALEVQP